VIGTVALGAALHGRLAASASSSLDAYAALAVTGMGISLILNAVILRIALEPLALLEAAAARVQEGDLDARAPHSPLVDPALQRLTRTFNAALDALAASRRRVRLILARLLEVDEAERRQVAYALESGVAQELAGILVRLRLLERDPRAPDLVELVERAGAEVGRAMEIVRGHAVGRRPAVLEELGLIPALEAEARRLMEAGSLLVRLEGVQPQGLRSEDELVLYRVLREALENAARHASARLVRVRFANGGGALVATVEDDGRGFDPVVAEDGPGLGIAGMRERTESAGGRISIWSSPGRGARVRVEIPLAGKAQDAPSRRSA
jgi:two-component system, NarL family, sensor histidine kinase UhpB